MSGRHKQSARAHLSPGRTMVPQSHPPTLLSRQQLPPPPLHSRPMPSKSLSNRQQHQPQILHRPRKRQRHLHSQPLRLSLQHLKHHPVPHSSHNPPHLHLRHRHLPRLAQVKVPARHRLLAPAKVRLKVRVPAPKQVVKA